MTLAAAIAPSGGLIVQPTPESVRVQLARIQASPDFDVPDRAHRFLGYVVEETLSDRAERIKAYSIALEVFGRDASFDAQADPVVRIEAGRVRRALERYYLTAGKSDTILITIPKGGYVPQFEGRPALEQEVPVEADEVLPTAPELRAKAWPAWAGPAAYVAGTMALLVLAGLIVWIFAPKAAPVGGTELAAAVDLPRLLIEPFENLSDDPTTKLLSRGLTEEIVGQIARFRDIVIIDRRAGDVLAGESSRDDAPRYILAGSVRTEGNAIRLTARLRSAKDNSLLWAKTFDANKEVQQLLSIESEIAKQVSTALAEPNGVIFQADSARVTETPPNDWQAYTCVLAYYSYRLDFEPKVYAFVRNCLERTVSQFPAYSTAWALLSITYFDGWRFRYDVRPTSVPPLDEAVAYARRAVDLDPQNVRGQQALMMALALKGEVPAALEVGKAALELNPNDIELRGEYGVRLALSGKWQEGRELILDTLQRSAGPESYYETVLGLTNYMLRDNEAAATWVRKASVQANPLYHLIAAMVFGRLGAKEDAAKERDWLMSNAQPLIENIHDEVAMRVATAEDQAYIMEGLRLAGIPIPPKAH